VAAGEDIEELARHSVVTKHFIAAAADVQVAVGAKGDALGFGKAAMTGELGLERAGFAIIGQNTVGAAAADV
jgi:hypothetical protein